MVKENIKVKITHDRLSILYALYLSASFAPENEHEELLITHMDDLKRRMGDMLDKEQVKYCLKLSLAEQLAFKQTWTNAVAIRDSYGLVIINKIIEDIDKEFHHRKILTHGNIKQG